MSQDDFDPLSAPVFGPLSDTDFPKWKCGRDTRDYFSKKKKSTGREDSIRFDSEGHGNHLRRISDVIQEESSAEVFDFDMEGKTEDVRIQVEKYSSSSPSSSSSSSSEEEKEQKKKALTATMGKPKLSIKKRDEPAILSGSTSSSSSDSESEEEVGDISSPSKKESETLPEKEEWEDFDGEKEDEGFFFSLIFRIIMIVRTFIFSSVEPELDEQGEIKEYVIEIKKTKFSSVRGLNGKFPFNETFFGDLLYKEKITVPLTKQSIEKINWLTCFQTVMAFFCTHVSPSTDCFFIPVDYKKNISFSREFSNNKRYDVLFNKVKIGEVGSRVNIHDHRENLVLRVLYNGDSFRVVLSSSANDEDFCSLEFSSTELSHLFNQTIASKKSIEDGSNLEGGVIYDLIGSSILVDIKTKRTVINVEGRDIPVDVQLMTLPRVLFRE